MDNDSESRIDLMNEREGTMKGRKEPLAHGQCDPVDRLRPAARGDGRREVDCITMRKRCTQNKCE